MAQPDVIAGTQMLVQIGDGGSPETFAHRCMINLSRSISHATQTQSDDIPDCDAPEAPSWAEPYATGKSVTITGSGYFDATDDEFFHDWWASGEAKNIKYKMNMAGALTRTGAFMLTNYDISGDRRAKGQVSLTLISKGPVTTAVNP